jgi:DNA-binding response OmpR family regulator
MSPARIVVAEEPHTIPAVLEALQGYELLTASTLMEAERLLLEDGIDLFVIGIHFNDSHAMELIKLIRSNKNNHAKTPIVVARFAPSEHAKILRETIEVMKVVHAVSDYIEKDGQPETFGARLREAVERFLPPAKVVRTMSTSSIERSEKH